MLGLLQRRARIHGGRTGREEGEADDKEISREEGKRLKMKFVIQRVLDALQRATNPQNDRCSLRVTAGSCSLSRQRLRKSYL